MKSEKYNKESWDNDEKTKVNLFWNCSTVNNLKYNVTKIPEHSRGKQRTNSM